MRDIEEDQELARRLDSVQTLLDHQTHESSTSDFSKKYKEASEKRISLLRDIATIEDMPQLASLIDKRRLDMPLTSFKLGGLPKEAQSRIFLRASTSS